MVSHNPVSNADKFPDKWSPPVLYTSLRPAESAREENSSLNEVISNLFPQAVRYPRTGAEGMNLYVRQTLFPEDWKYARSSLISDIQDLLCCLAPFTSVINMKGLKRYISHLKQQPALAHLPFDLWEDLIREAVRRGFLSSSPHTSVLAQVQPVFPFFLKTRLYAFERKEKRDAVETAFRKYYVGMADALYHIMESNKTDEKELGQNLIKPEYENLVTALYFALDAKASVFSIYRTLSHYLDFTGDHDLRLRLGKMVLTGLEEYPREKLVGDMGAEFIVIIDDIARHQLFLGQYAEAERSYQTALTVWIQNVYYDPAIVRRRSGAIYHQLGRVAQEQEKWDQAKAYFLKDLEIAREYNDLKGMTTTLRNLHRLWKKSSDPELPENIAEVLGWTIKKIEK